MTPNSTDRLGAVSPLDSLLAAGHAAASPLKPSQAFESILNHVSGQARIAAYRSAPPHPSPPAAERPSRDSRPDDEPSADDARAASRSSRKTSAKTPRKEDSQPAADGDQDDQDAASDGAARADAGTQPQNTAPTSQDDQAPAAEDGAAADEVNASDSTSQGDRGSKEERPTLVDGLPAALPQPGDNQDQGNSQAQAAPATAEGTSSATSQAAPDPAASQNQQEPQVKQPTLASDLPGQTAVASEEAASKEKETAAAKETIAPIQRPEVKTQEVAASSDPLVAIDATRTTVDQTQPQPTEQHEKGREEKSGGDKSDAAKQASPENVAAPPTLLPDQISTPSQDATAAQAQAQTQAQATGAPLTSKEPQPAPGNGSPSNAVQGPASRLPGRVLAQGEARRGRPAAPVEIDSARFLSRVARAFTSAQQRGGEVRLRLSPPELGSLRLQVSVQDGVMVARMETETEAARSSLVNNLPTLRERLAEQGIRVERFDIDLMQRPSTGTPDRPSDPQQRDDMPQLRPLRPLSTASADSPAPTATATSWNGQGRLNVII